MKEKLSVVVKHVMHFLKKSQRDNIPALAGQSSFFLILSVIPMLLFAFSIFSILTGKDIDISDFPEVANQQAFPYLEALLRYIIDSVHKATSGTAIITAVMMLWSAGKGMYCITDGILRVYHIPNNKFWLIKRIYAMGYTVVTLLMILCGIVVIVFCFFFAGVVKSLTGDTTQVNLISRILIVALFSLFQSVMLTLALKLFLRRKLKNRVYCTMRALYPGMLITVIAWNFLTFGVVLYIRYFAVSSIYGSLASVFVTMIWVYFMMYILLYGIQINYIYREHFSAFRLFKRREKIKRSEKEPIEPKGKESSS